METNGAPSTDSRDALIVGAGPVGSGYRTRPQYNPFRRLVRFDRHQLIDAVSEDGTHASQLSI